MFALTRASEEKEREPLSEVLVENRPVGVRVPGLVLEAQYSCRGDYLLLTTDDTPYEEALHVILLDCRFVMRDRVDLGHPYAAGTLQSLRSPADDVLQFSFFGGDVWQVTVKNAPRRLRLSEVPVGIERRIRRLLVPRRLVIERMQ